MVSFGKVHLRAEVSSEVGLTPSIEYKFAPNIVGEVLLAIPFEHEVKNHAKWCKSRNL
jgi:outer membrane protein W